MADSIFDSDKAANDLTDPATQAKPAPFTL
jgi:hypothetical protein